MAVSIGSSLPQLWVVLNPSKLEQGAINLLLKLNVRVRTPGF